MFILKLVIYGITASIFGLALRYLWKHLKDQRDRLLKAYWRPARVGLLVFAAWILWELLWFYTIGINDKPDWAKILKGCGDNSEGWYQFSFCGIYAHMAYFLYLLALSIPKAAVVGILAAFLLKMDPVAKNIIATDNDKKPPKQTLKERIGSSIRSTRVSVSNKKKGIAGGIRSTRDSVSNMGKKVARFHPWKIFGKRKSKNQPVPSAEENQPANEPHEQTDAVVHEGVVTEKGEPSEKKENKIENIATSAGAKIGSTVKVVGRTATTAGDSVSNMGKNEPQEQTDAIVHESVVTEKGEPSEKKENKIEIIATSVGAAIGSTAKAAGNIATSAGATIGSTAKTVGRTTTSVGTTIGSTAKSAGTTIGSTAKSAGKTIGSTAKSAKTTIGSAVETVGHAATSAGDSVLNVGKKVVGFRPGKIFRRRKKDDQPTPSVEKKPPADDPKEQ